MKAVYTKNIELIVLLKDGNEYRFNSDNTFGRSYYFYGIVPECEEIELTVSEYVEEYQLFHIKSGSTFLKRRMYEVFAGRPYDKKIYRDEIDRIVIKKKYRVIENPRIEWLEKDLGFKGYSELVFDREQELKKLMMKV